MVGGLWAIYNFQKARRLEAAKWLKQLFSEFYIDDTFARVRELFEYRYMDELGPLIERRITNREIDPCQNEIELLRELDTLLNYFEYLLYLQEKRHISRNDLQAVFRYWLDLMREEQRGGLRRYAAKFDFEGIAKELKAKDEDFIALYGSLMASVGGLAKSEFPGLLHYVGQCKINGQLVDLGEYPGLVLGVGTVEAELYEVLDDSVFKRLDEFERYDPRDFEGSLYVRRCMRLTEPNRDAWVYIYNQDPEGKPNIAGGSWKAHLSNKQRS